MTDAADLETPPLSPERVVQRDLIVVGASAGGVDALQRLVAGLPAELPASILVVLHLAAGTSVLDQILARAGELPVTQARDGEQLERGHVYVGPPDRHLLVRGTQLRLSAGPRENGHRPAIDPMFRSAARAYGKRVIGVVLTGTLDDGTDGLRFIKERGGATVVQDPADAVYADMPRSAVDWVDPDRVVALDSMGAVLYDLLDAPLDPPPEADVAAAADQEADIVEVEFGQPLPPGDGTLITCPECGGVLIEKDLGGVTKYSCQVGHAYSPASLADSQSVSLESALWNAQRTLEERADLLRRIGKRNHRANRGTGSRFDERAAAVERHAITIRDTILRLRASENGDVAAGEHGA